MLSFQYPRGLLCIGFIRVTCLILAAGLPTLSVADGHRESTAVPFARGDIIGVWDAEDAPEPGQLRTVAATFATAPPEVVCLQGRLDFYNPAQNWLSRCFALDYAGWFRVFLPGLA